MLPPEGALFALGRPGGKKKPPRCAFGLLPPEGALFALGRPGGKKKPRRAMSTAGLLCLASVSGRP
ncbi:hypothetical protein CE205_16645 [Achromobacter insolitus]|nr:hypothetical protein CE205_16645 [Achromobacter insolitus]